MRKPVHHSSVIQNDNAGVSERYPRTEDDARLPAFSDGLSEGRVIDAQKRRLEHIIELIMETCMFEEPKYDKFIGKEVSHAYVKKLLTLKCLPSV